MADPLAGKTFLSGASITAKVFTFTRASLDSSSANPTDYTDALIELVLYNDEAANTPAVIITTNLGEGLERLTNSEDIQSVYLTITEAQLDTLLNGTDEVVVGYAWSITPSGGSPIRAYKGGGYDGKFTIEKESKAGR